MSSGKRNVNTVMPLVGANIINQVKQTLFTKANTWVLKKRKECRMIVAILYATSMNNKLYDYPEVL